VKSAGSSKTRRRRPGLGLAKHKCSKFQMIEIAFSLIAIEGYGEGTVNLGSLTDEIKHACGLSRSKSYYY
jgi:hypothetical protein